MTFEARLAVMRLRVDGVIERHADAAHAEIKAMAESARRSIGQLTRRDYLAKRAPQTTTPAPEKPITLGSWFEPVGAP